MQQVSQTLLMTFAIVAFAGCSSAEDQLKRCLSDTPYQTGLFDALTTLENQLLATGTLKEKSLAGYSKLVNEIEKGNPIPGWNTYCLSNPNCEYMGYPSVIASYVTCPTRIDIPNPLAEPARWSEQNGDVGYPYMQRVLESLDERSFGEIVYRGALLQAIAMTMEDSWDEGV